MKSQNNITTHDMERQAKRAGLQVIQCKGSHKKFRNPETGECMTYCDREMGPGLKHKVLKWLTAAGVMFSLLILVLIGI